MAGGRSVNDHMLILRAEAAVRWPRHYRHAIEDRRPSVVPADQTGLTTGNGDRRRAGAAPWQERRGVARFPAVGNAASIQAGSRDIREIPDPSRSFALGSKDDARLFAATGSVYHVRLQP